LQSLGTNKIILGSSSPRRRELLSYLVDAKSFEVATPDVDEKKLPHETPKQYVRRNAMLKATAVSKKFSAAAGQRVLVIAADTIVVFDDQVLEKPVDQKDAQRMLKLLSGSTHQVLTGLVVFEASVPKCKEMVVETEVNFRTLSLAEIDGYIATGEPMDKAGAYGAQGRGSAWVRSIVGSYTNVVGLPLAELGEILKNDFAVTLS